MAKTELTDNQVAEVKAALLRGDSPPNPSGGTLVFDAKVDGYWRKATAEEARAVETELGADLAELRKINAVAGTDNP